MAPESLVLSLFLIISFDLKTLNFARRLGILERRFGDFVGVDSILGLLANSETVADENIDEVAMTVSEEDCIRDVEDPARNAKSAKRLQPDDSFHCHSIATLSDAPSASLTVASSLSFWSRLGEMIHEGGKTFLYPLSRIVRSSRLTSSITVLVLSDKGGLTLRAGKGSVSKYGYVEHLIIEV